jgi:general secretion pathway protein C
MIIARMSARWWTLAVWALAAASAVFWGLRLFVKPQAAPPHTQFADAGAALRGDLSRVLGVEAVPVAVTATAPEPAPDARFQLLGVVSPRSPRAATTEGVALIAVDGKPPKAYRVGATVDGATVLQSVHARGAMLGPRGGAALVALTLPPPPPAATGVPGTMVPGDAGMAQPMPPMPPAGAAVPPGMPVPGQPARMGSPPQQLMQPQAQPIQPQAQPIQPLPAQDAQQRQ